ncbi:MAG: enoyl-CoA hydratase/isomerase family protein [Pseudomonadales bacterium]|nr:enoyl-CoA hydratase/isomerase family protein [Pseudomonadales bacterium]
MSPVLFEEIMTAGGKRIGVGTLNVEKTLNSLSLEMIDLLTAKLLEWQDDDDLILVILQGAGDRAFCAGGDIQDLYRSMVEHPGGPNEYADAFFEREYRLDHLIHTFVKPIVCWAHGIVMGGGLGVMAGCSHRLGTETSRIAMPEITIGLFPDASATWFLTRMPKHLAHYLAWTGSHLNAVDARKVGFVDRLVKSDQREPLTTALMEAQWRESVSDNLAVLDEILDRFQSPADEFPGSKIDAHEDTIRDIVEAALASESPLETFSARLEALKGDDAWLDRGVEVFRAGSPTSAHLILEQIERAEGLHLKETLMLELIMAIQCSRHHDFAEGIRALLIDRDNNPCWKYSSVSSVPREWIEEHFAPPWGDGVNPLSDLDKA